MTQAVRSWIETFETLSEAERREAVVELLRRAGGSDLAELEDETLVEAAESVFLELDAREDADAQPQPR
jgi:hypothetical protein